MLMIFFIVECEIDFDYNNYIKPPIGHEFYVVIFLNILDLAEMRGLLRYVVISILETTTWVLHFLQQPTNSILTLEDTS